MEFLDVVNERDEIIGRASRQDIYHQKLTHRIVHVLIFNDKGEMALQLRSRSVQFCPQHWCTAAGGHVSSGESYEEAALREFKEEIGAQAELAFAHKDLYEAPNSGLKKILVTFTARYNGPFKANPQEVDRVEFFTFDAIRKMITRGEKIHPELLFLLKKHFEF